MSDKSPCMTATLHKTVSFDVKSGGSHLCHVRCGKQYRLSISCAKIGLFDVPYQNSEPKLCNLLCQNSSLLGSNLADAVCDCFLGHVTPFLCKVNAKRRVAIDSCFCSQSFGSLNTRSSQRREAMSMLSLNGNFAGKQPSRPCEHVLRITSSQSPSGQHVHRIDVTILKPM